MQTRMTSPHMVMCTLHICANKRKRLRASPRIRAGGRIYAHAPIYPFPKGIYVYVYTYAYTCMHIYVCIYRYAHAQTLAREPHTQLTHPHYLQARMHTHA